MERDLILDAVEKRCREMLAKNHHTTVDWILFSEFVADNFDRYVQISLSQSNIYYDCTKGCSLCCNHWVEDVYSFESMRLIMAIHKRYPDLLSRISFDSVFSEQQMEKIFENSSESDEIELLQQFYRLEIPCPLLGSNGECRLYNERPLTCRTFYSRSKKRFCLPNADDNEADGTFMIQFPEYVESLLDDVHSHASHEYSFPLALRSMLVYVQNQLST